MRSAETFFTSMRASMALGLKGVSSTFDCPAAWRPHSAVVNAVSIGIAITFSHRGLLTKLRVQRHGHRLLVPVYLAATPSPYELLGALLAKLLVECSWDCS